MTKQVIPEAAAEAAYAAINYPDQRAIDHDEILTILEAAAPHMLAPVYEEGWLASRDFYLRFEGPAGGLDANPYRTTA